MTHLKPSFWRRMKAFFLRSFHAHCPACGHMFFGHESHTYFVKLQGRMYRILCGECHRKAIDEATK